MSGIFLPFRRAERKVPTCYVGIAKEPDCRDGIAKRQRGSATKANYNQRGSSCSRWGLCSFPPFFLPLHAENNL